MDATFATIREAVRARERHMPMFHLFRSIEEHREIPQTFQGEMPSEAFANNPSPRLKIGGIYALPGPDGTEVKGRLTQATVMGNEAKCVLYDQDANQAFIATFPLSAEDVADYARYPDTSFGAYQRQPRGIESTMEMFDFFFETYRETPKDKLLELMVGHANQDEFLSPSQKDLAELLCERLTLAAIAAGASPEAAHNAERFRKATG